MRATEGVSALLVVVGLALSGCNDGGTSTARLEAAESFWEAARITGDERTPYGDFPDMAARSDAVVLGSFGEVVGTRTVGDSAPVAYTQVELEIETVLSGRLPDRSVVLEFLADVPADADLPPGQILVFLHEKQGPDEAGLWRPLNSRGLWATTARASIDTPLNEDAPAQDPLYADLVDRSDDIRDLTDGW